MRNTTFKEAKDAAGDARVIRESEFAKPYGEQYEEPHEDFWAMEYGAPNWPPWGWDFPGMEDPASGWHVTFLCDIDPCYEKGGSRIFNAKCGWEIVSVEFDPPEAKLGVSFDGTTVTITAAADASGTGHLTITMRAVFKVGESTVSVTGTHSNISVSECTDSSVLCDDSQMAWDKVNSGDTVARNGTVSVYIEDPGGLGSPYTWALSGTGSGMALTDAVTTGLSNVITASGSACGNAIITVTGCDGSQVVDTVRCTSGSWNHCGLFDYKPNYAPYNGVCSRTGACGGSHGACDVGMYRYVRNAGAGGLNVGCPCSSPCCSCGILIACSNPGPWTHLSVALLAADPRSACTYPYAEGSFCMDSNSFVWYDWWSC